MDEHQHQEQVPDPVELVDLARDAGMVLDPLLQCEDHEPSAHDEHEDARPDQDEAHHELRLGVAGHERDLGRTDQECVHGDREHHGPDDLQPFTCERGLLRGQLFGITFADPTVDLPEMEDHEVEREEVDAGQDALSQPDGKAGVLAELGRTGRDTERDEREENVRQSHQESHTEHILGAVEARPRDEDDQHRVDRDEERRHPDHRPVVAVGRDGRRELHGIRGGDRTKNGHKNDGHEQCSGKSRPLLDVEELEQLGDHVCLLWHTF